MRAPRPEQTDERMAGMSAEVKADVDQVIEAIIYFTTETRRITKELARRASLTGPQLTILKILETIGDLSLSEVSDRIRAQNSTVTGIIDRMEREGLVLRVRSQEDRRVIRIHLTDKGAKVARKIPVEPVELLRGALAGLGPEETKQLLHIMTKIAKRIRTVVRRDIERGSASGAGPLLEAENAGDAASPREKRP